MKELILKEDHPWANREIRELNISRHTLIVMVRRGGKLLIPDGSLLLLPGDMLVMHTKRTYRDMQAIPPI